MRLTDGIFIEILEGYFTSKTTRFTQKGLSEKLHVSIGLVNKTIAKLEQAGAVERAGRGFSLVDAKKLLAIFATQRKLASDVIFSTHYEGGVKEIEKLMPNEACFTGCSAYRLKYDDAPADYGKVYVYADGKIGRFAENKGEPNLFVLKNPGFAMGKIAPVSLIYADLWNMRDWFAAEYLKALERRLFNA